MKPIGVIGAMDEEIAYLESQMSNKNTHKVADAVFVEGILKERKVIIVKSGIGKVNAAMTTTILLERFKPEAIINTGTAGGFSSQLNVADLVIGRETVHHDVDVTAFDYAYGQVPGMPETFIADNMLIASAEQGLQELNVQHKIGLIATGDSFMNDPAKIAEVQHKFPELIAMEMEAAAIAQVCHQYGIPFIIVRALSDIAGKDSSMSFEQFVSIASKNAASLIIKMLNEI